MINDNNFVKVYCILKCYWAIIAVAFFPLLCTDASIIGISFNRIFHHFCQLFQFQHFFFVYSLLHRISIQNHKFSFLWHSSHVLIEINIFDLVHWGKKKSFLNIYSKPVSVTCRNQVPGARKPLEKRTFGMEF